MTYDDFIWQVQRRARLHTSLAALRATEATLRTLAERLTTEEASDLASQLPRELQSCFDVPGHGARLSLTDFYQNVAVREEAELAPAVSHAHVVIEVLQEAVSPGEIADVRAQLPPDWVPLFEPLTAEQSGNTCA